MNTKRIYDCDEGCPVEATIGIIGGKWKSLIIYHLLYRQRRFGELQRLIPSVSQRMLTEQLRQLEADGIVHREVYRQVPPKVEYSLTTTGMSIAPIILEMRKWGTDYLVKKPTSNI